MWDHITRFATDRIQDLDKTKNAVTNEMKWAAKQLRDNVVVPALDSGMEKGIIPADAGMYGRYLTGTTVPLTRMPADVKEGEQQYVDHRLNLDSQSGTRKKQYDQLKAEQDALGLSFDKDYSNAGNKTREKIARYNDLAEKMLRLDPSTIPENSKPVVPFDPKNYNTTGYGSTQTALYAKGDSITNLRNTLGQYVVKDGVVIDKYDFDSNNSWAEGKPFEHGGAFGKNILVEQLATGAGRLSQSLGLISPTSGYEIRMNTGRK